MLEDLKINMHITVVQTTDIPPEENERYNNYSENHNDEYRHQQQDVEVDNHDHHQSHSTNDKDVSDVYAIIK